MSHRFLASWHLIFCSLVIPFGGRLSAAEPPPAMTRLTFQQALDTGLAHNPTLLHGLLDIERANAQTEQARSGSLPILTGNGSYVHLDSNREAGGLVLAWQNELNANVALQAPLIAPQRWAQWARASDAAKTVQVSFEETRRQVANTIARGYLTILSQHRVVEINIRALANARAHFEYARTRFLGGIGNRLDEVRAAQEASTDESQVEVSQSTLFQAQETLGTLIGADGPVDVTQEAPLPPTPSYDLAMRDAETRADVRASQIRLRSAEHSSQLDWTDYMPLLGAALAPFYNAPPTTTAPRLGWQAQVILTIPFYDGGLRYGQQHEREDLRRDAQVTLISTLRQAHSDVRTAFDDVRRADSALKAAREAAQLADQAQQLAIFAYKAGATTNLEVIDAERRARDAETAAAQAEDASRQARLELLVASGHFP